MPGSTGSFSGLGDLRGRAVLVIVGGLFCQLALGYGYIYGQIAPDIIADLGWTRATIASARTPQLLVMALAMPIVGFLCVRIGARPILVTAALLLGVSMLVLSQIQSVSHLYAAAVLQALVGAGMSDITVGAIVTRWIVKGRGLALGIVYTGSNLAAIIIAPTLAWFATSSSWRTAVLAIGLAGMVIILPFAAFAVREPRPGEGPAYADGAQGDARADEAALDLRGALRTRSFWLLGFAIFAFFFYFVGMLDHLILFLIDSGMDRSEAASYFSVAIGMGMVSKLGFGWVADRIEHHRALMLDFALLLNRPLLVLALPQPAVLPVFVLSFGFATAARDVVYPLVIADCFGTKYLAEVYGGLLLLLPSGALGAFFAGYVHDHFGSYTIAFATFAVLNALAVCALWFVRPEIGEARGQTLFTHFDKSVR